MTTEIYAALYLTEGRYVLGLPCKTRDCAEQSVSVFEGADVVGFVSGAVELLPEPVLAMRFAIDRAKEDA